MAEVIGVKFKEGGKVYYFDPGEITVNADEAVIVETARGMECGIVAAANREVSEDEIVKPLKKVIRLATPKDVAQMEENRRREAHAFEVCQQKILDHKMDMKLVDVEYTFDNSKILFYFTADGRVDFRDLVKDLAGIFRTRIELRQIGVRDEAKMLGGLGICGRPFCCSTFLSDFQPVSIKMAKEQGLSLNPTKISGTCGRLMCCLKYENDAYQDLLKHTPAQDSLVDTPQGRGTVMDTSLLKGTCRVRLLDDPENPCTVCCSDCVVLRHGKEKKGGQPVRPASEAEEPAEQKPQETSPPRPRRERKPEGEQKQEGEKKPER
ncbi:MAG: stage 0 sporulation family protein, partial [Oscillospiraceae bacterium]|nr:stage 0 sporulation family protein [Oscillospiraceae bacterium]